MEPVVTMLRFYSTLNIMFVECINNAEILFHAEDYVLWNVYEYVYLHVTYCYTSERYL